MQLEKIHRSGYFPQDFKQIFNRLKNNCMSHQKEFKIFKDHQKMVDKAILEIKSSLSAMISDHRQSN